MEKSILRYRQVQHLLAYPRLLPFINFNMIMRFKFSYNNINCYITHRKNLREIYINNYFFKKKKTDKCIFAVQVKQFYFSSKLSWKNFDSTSLFLRQPSIQCIEGVRQFLLHFSGVLHIPTVYWHSSTRVLHPLRHCSSKPWTYTDSAIRTRKASINRFICSKKVTVVIITSAHTMTLSNRNVNIVKAKS